MSSRVRVYLACSLDGFIAGPDDDLAWLERDHSAAGDLPADPDALKFEAFLAQVGAMLMGRRTYDVASKMSTWAYGAMPIVVATRRSLAAARPSVHAAEGSIHELVDRAKSLAGGKDVYLDGGDLVRQALDAGLVDEMCLTLVPVLLAKGIRLFDGLSSSSRLQFISHRAFGGGLVQVTARTRPA